jgi:thioredoxin reductase
MDDVLIIGGGPAGLSAALMLGRVRRHVVVADAGDGRNAPARQMNGYLGCDGVAPAEFRQNTRKELERYPSVRMVGATVTGISGTCDDGFTAALDDGSEVRARTVLLAGGIRDELPPLPGVRAAWGTHVFQCPYCHGWEVRDAPIAVLGASMDVAFLAQHLRQLSDSVTVHTAGEATHPDFPAHLQRHAIAVDQAPVDAVRTTPDDRLEVVSGASAKPYAGMFLIPGAKPTSTLPTSLGCELLGTRVLVDDYGATNVPGVYAAGDLARTRSLQFHSAISAAATGAQTATEIDLLLRIRS